jgi:hypothetical protein
MGIEPTSHSDCRSTVLKLANRTTLTWIERAFPQVSGPMTCPLLSPADPSVPRVMAREDQLPTVDHGYGAAGICPKGRFSTSVSLHPQRRHADTREPLPFRDLCDPGNGAPCGRHVRS